VVLPLLGEPLVLCHHLLDHRQVRLHDFRRELVGETVGELAVFADHVLRELRRVTVAGEELVESPACPLLAPRPRVLLAVVGVFRKEGGVERMLHDSEEETSPGDEGVVGLVLGSEGVDDTVLVRFEDEAEEGTLNGEGGGVGGV
jgi:hypothetical protein